MKIECYIDGSSIGNPGPSGIGIYIPNKLELSLYTGHGTNNQAEMTALIVSILELEKLKPTSSIIYTDSELVAFKKIKDPKLLSLRRKADRHLGNLANVEVKWIDRHENKKANKLAQRAAKHKLNERNSL